MSGSGRPSRPTTERSLVADAAARAREIIDGKPATPVDETVLAKVEQVIAAYRAAVV